MFYFPTLEIMHKFISLIHLYVHLFFYRYYFFECPQLLVIYCKINT